MLSGLIIVVIAIVALLTLLSMAVNILKEYERGVLFRLGRLAGVKGPGLVFIIPFIDRLRIVDLRVVTLDVPTQEAITRDNVTVKVSALKANGSGTLEKTWGPNIVADGAIIDLTFTMTEEAG